MRRWGALNAELKDAGVCVAASGLHVDATTTVRPSDRGLAVTDGPFAGTPS